MFIPKNLSLVLFLASICLTALRPVHEPISNCSNFEYKVELVKIPTQELSTLTLTASGGKTPYYYLLLDNKNNLVSNDFSKKVFEGLKQGRYRCIVTDSNDCTKEQFIEVK